jgi:hypothetical protein
MYAPSWGMLEKKSDLNPQNLVFLSISQLRIFGSRCWYFIPKTQTRKLDDRSCEAMMVWYSTPQNGYKLCDVKLKRMVVSRDIKFAEVLKASNDVSY